MKNTAARINKRRPVHYRTIFISDVHLGYPGCSAHYLLDFLRSTTCDYLFLVGDIIDMWQMQRRFHWPQEHNDVLRTILGKAKHGTSVIYVPGNHDEALREYDGMEFGNVKIRNSYIHTTDSGLRLYITHGDQFDAVVRHSRIVSMLGSSLYELVLGISTCVNTLRRRLGFPYWSLAKFLKHKVKKVVNYIDSFENALAYEASRKGVDGLVSGHIHKADICRIEDIIYCNCGDWVESNTALVEKQDGSLELLHWTEEPALVKRMELQAA